MFILVIAMVVYRAHLKIESTKSEYEKRVTSFLVEEKGYDQQDI